LLRLLPAPGAGPSPRSPAREGPAGAHPEAPDTRRRLATVRFAARKEDVTQAPAPPGLPSAGLRATTGPDHHPDRPDTPRPLCSKAFTALYDGARPPSLRIGATPTDPPFIVCGKPTAPLGRGFGCMHFRVPAREMLLGNASARPRIHQLEKRLSQDIGEKAWHESGLGAPTDIDQLQAKITNLEQQTVDLRLQLEERAQDLDAARAANRDLMTRLNTPGANR
jgi:hypothetical protein